MAVSAVSTYRSITQLRNLFLEERAHEISAVLTEQLRGPDRLDPNAWRQIMSTSSRSSSSEWGSGPKRLTAEAQSVLSHYDWPGNVRELQNAIERALIMARSDEITPVDLPVQIPRPSAQVEATDTLADIEKMAILRALESNQGDRRRTAEQLNISLRTLQCRLKEYGVTSRD